MGGNISDTLGGGRRKHKFHGGIVSHRTEAFVISLVAATTRLRRLQGG